MKVCVSVSPVVIIGFENETYTASEGQGSVTVCARVMSGGLGRDVEVTLATQDESAVGKFFFFNPFLNVAGAIWCETFIL